MFSDDSWPAFVSWCTTLAAKISSELVNPQYKNLCFLSIIVNPIFHDFPHFFQRSKLSATSFSRGLSRLALNTNSHPVTTHWVSNSHKCPTISYISRWVYVEITATNCYNHGSALASCLTAMVTFGRLRLSQVCLNTSPENPPWARSMMNQHAQKTVVLHITWEYYMSHFYITTFYLSIQLIIIH